MIVLFPGDDQFEDAAAGRVFNGYRPERRPAAVLIAQTEEEVARGVRLARERGWQVVVRSGGHSWAAWALREGALLIDVHRLKSMSYDEQTGIASVGAGVIGGEELAPFLAERGRMFPGGHCPSVGLAGFFVAGRARLVRTGLGVGRRTPRRDRRGHRGR